jgi:hypothetical protein
MITFNKYTDENGVEQIEKVDELGNKSYVPNDPANSDYQRYLNPEAEQPNV